MQPDALTALLEGVITEALAPIADRLGKLETQIATLELKDGMSTAAAAAIVGEVATIRHEAAAIRERVAVVEVKALIPGPPGKDGADGRDGFDLKAFDVALDPEDLRTLRFTFGDGEHTKEARIRAPWFLDRGVYRDGTAYESGDVVSWDGSAWVAREATTARPGSAGSAWRLCVKRGRDGSR
jgi:hypothetical protein